MRQKIPEAIHLYHGLSGDFHYGAECGFDGSGALPTVDCHDSVSVAADYFILSFGKAEEKDCKAPLQSAPENTFPQPGSKPRQQDTD